MAEQQDEQSKRERQKARRQARRQQELARARREQATSKTLRLLGLLAVLALIGWFVGNWIVDWRTDRQLLAQSQERAEEAGCDDGGIQPDQGAGHIEDVAAVTPKAIYPDRPASSGPHLGTVVRTGVYDELIDERLMVHNLEHGYVNVYYSEDAPAEQVEQMKDWVRQRIDSGNPKMVVAPAIGEWSDPDADFAFVAWRYRQFCDAFDEAVLLAFMNQHYGLKGIAPEKGVPAHMGGGGVLDPADAEGPLLLPPLTQEDTDPEPAAASTASPSSGATASPSASPSASAPASASPAPEVSASPTVSG